ncbi:MAG: hypothetical protein CL930_07145 [Deltaproteobacteria bacterium]|nr:hypothetical protein [Deltaproteobacteria bacterium]
MTQNTTALTQWCGSLPVLPDGCTFLNFVASHDGVGLRPAEGILTTTQLNELVECVASFGGCLTHRTRPDGSLSPYEANIAFFDACRGTVDGIDEWQVERFLVSQGVMLSMAGVPALYYNSLLSAPNDLLGLEETGRNRTINRTKWTRTEIDERLADPAGQPAQVLRVIKEMLRVRQQQPAFHPEALQSCWLADPRLFVIRRTSRLGDQQLCCVYNLSASSVLFSKSELGVKGTGPLDVLFSHGEVVDKGTDLVCSPYAMVWIALVASQ